ncbi:hypothetical protein P8452_74614 [Trifolium repens]|nr:hypothetical protein P8452_74614 [Trifolium repens]
MLSTWSNKEDCCNWRGVHCDINGRVTNLSLPCFTDDFIIGSKKNKTHCLEGKFHLTLFELEYLNYLDLSNNDFKAIHLPMDCQNLSLVKTPLHGSGNFSNVVHLDLSENENLVIDDLRWLLRLSSSLQYLNMSFVNLHKETHWLQILTMFPSLSKLQLSNCLLESVNPSLLYANFTSLEYLDLSCNYFISEFPIWLLNISGLSYLDLRSNHFHGQIPKTLLNLRNLDSLFLGDNMFSGKIPEWLGQLGGLKILGLSYNLFTGSIPTTLGNLSSLTVLRVASNPLTGTLPECFGQLSTLEELDVRGYNLSGVISKRNFAKLSNLQILLFASPSFNFDFDPNWIPPFKLQYLVLEYVDLKLIPWFYTQTSLIYIKIENSLFNNESQEMFWNLTTHCQYLSLSYNTMPWDMSNVLLNSEIVWLDGNGLSGGLPRLTSNMVLKCTLSLQCGNHHVKALYVLRDSNGHNLYFTVAFNYGV